MAEFLTFVYLFFILTSLYLSILLLLLHYDNRGNFHEDRKAKKYPNLSVLIPAYNEEDTIGKTIQAVLDSDYPKNRLEIIAINDGSKDNTLLEMKKFGDQIKILDKKNSGKADSLNQAMQIAKGEIIAPIAVRANAKTDSSTTLGITEPNT